MLITSGHAMMGTIVDDIDKMTLRLGIGDCLTFGSFINWVDSFSLPVRFPMLWHVIERQDNKLKLLSYFFFGHAGYWEVREKLNTKCFYECFSESERDAILTTDVKTIIDGSTIATQDKLFVPALKDIESAPEHLKIGRFLYVSEGEIPSVDLGYCFYWLRDSGERENENLVVQGYEDSNLVIDSLSHDADEVGVRAVMWVDSGRLKGLRES